MVERLEWHVGNMCVYQEWKELLQIQQIFRLYVKGFTFIKAFDVRNMYGTCKWMYIIVAFIMK